MYTNQFPILSIVIPTKDRYDTLIPLLSNVLNWNTNNFELIIQDNSINNETILSYLKHNISNKIKYFYSSDKMSAIQNCDLAVSKATGFFVIFIGDDDGVSSRIIEFCQYMYEREIDSAFFNCSLYTWPDLEFKMKVNDFMKGNLYLPNFDSTIKTINVEENLVMVLQSGGQSLHALPRLYHGIVKRSILNEMFLNLNTFFPGAVPDMSNAIALTKFVKNHIYANIPLVISGHSKKSMSGKNVIRRHQGELKDEPSLPGDLIENWDEKIPFFWSGPTIWAISCVQALKKINKIDYLKFFKYHKLYSSCFAYVHNKYNSRIFYSIYSSFPFFKATIILLKALVFTLKIFILRIFVFLNKKIYKKNGIYCLDIDIAIKENDKVLTSIDLGF